MNFMFRKSELEKNIYFFKKVLDKSLIQLYYIYIIQLY